jgi:allophanate hydrolase
MRTVFEIEQVGPFVSIQDAGRNGYARYGVTKSGPMDRLAHSLTNYALGKHDSSSAIEVSLGGLTLKCIEGEITAATGGGYFSINLDGSELAPWSIFTLQEGSVLKIRSGEWGSWCYLSFLGDIQAMKWLGSWSVHQGSGLCGLPYKQGDKIIVENGKSNADTSGSFFDPKTLKPSPEVRIVQGPQDNYFEDISISKLYLTEFKLTSEYDRMGVRLNGEKLKVNRALDMPSEPVARGSIQVPGHGDPICLLADHQTTGGYPKIGTIISADQDTMAQKRVGDVVTFAKTNVDDAIAVARQKHLLIDVMKEEIERNRASFIHKLWSNNLISGVVGTSQD